MDPVPPSGYGGIEAVVDLLCEALVDRGHEVTLFAAPGSRSAARVRTPLEAAHPDAIGSSLHESDHTACAWGEIDLAAKQGRAFDVVHDHSGLTALAMADRVSAPVVHTVHGPFDENTERFYQRHGHKARLVAISRSQVASTPPGVSVADVVPNPIAVDRWPLRVHKQDYRLWIGRMDPIKGAHRAVEATRLAGRTLVLAGPMQTGQESYYRERVQPQVDGLRVQHNAEVGGTAKQELLANATALLMPVRWREPFGMVMVETLACGTPVIAFPEGAAAEIVIDGENGMLVADETEMAHAIERVGSIDPARCRASVAERYDVAVTPAGYEDVYRRATATEHILQASCAAEKVPERRQLSGLAARCALMGDRAAAAGTDRTQPRSVGDRDVARALALLESNQAGAITIAALRERGVKAPAQAVYTLQLAGYGIDRVSCEDPEGRRTLGYRLHRPSGPVSDRLAGSREADGEEA